MYAHLLSVVLRISNFQVHVSAPECKFFPNTELKISAYQIRVCFCLHVYSMFLLVTCSIY